MSLDKVVFKGQELHCVASWGTINVAVVSEKRVDFHIAWNSWI
jgi:hypothetical protein